MLCRLGFAAKIGPTAVRAGAVASGGPADRAGLLSGNIIVCIDGEPLSGTDDLLRKLNAEKNRASGGPVRVTRRIADGFRNYAA